MVLGVEEDKTASPECWRHYYGAREYVCNCPGRTDDTGREESSA